MPIFVQFNEPVQLPASAFSLVSGTMQANSYKQIGPNTYSFNVTPKLPNGEQIGDVTVTLNQLGATDAYGNQNQIPGQVCIHLLSALPKPSATVSTKSQNVYSQVFVKFNQSVTGFTLASVQVSANAKVTDLNGAGDSYNFWVTALPATSDLGKTMSIVVTIPAGAAKGADGLPLTAPVMLTITTQTITGPTAYIDFNPTQPVHQNWFNSTATPPGPVPYVVVFSQPVTGFGAGNLIPTGATASTPTLDPSDPTNRTYKFTLTPSSGTTANMSVGLAPGEIEGPGGAPLMGIPHTIATNLSPEPVVTNITSTFSGPVSPGTLIPITVTFSGPVRVNSVMGQIQLGIPALILNAIGPAGPAVATYVSGGLGPQQPLTTTPDGRNNVLIFNYVVQAGQLSTRLDVLNNLSLTTMLPSGRLASNFVANNIVGPDGKSLDRSFPILLFTPGSAGSLSANSQIAVGTSATGVVGVSSALANGTYGTTTTIPITVTFNGPITVDTTGGTPTLTLALAGGTTAVATYSGPSGPNAIVFNFKPVAGQNSPALQYVSSNALSTNGGKILIAGTSTSVDPTLPAPGTTGSLSRNKILAVTDHAAKVLGVWDNQTNQPAVGVGQVVQILVTFDGPVTVNTGGGTPTLLLALDGGKTTTAKYSSGSGTTSLVFLYTVAAGDQSIFLDVASSSALALNGATIRDALNNNAVLTLPPPGTPGSLRSNNTMIAGAPPQVQSVTAVSVNGGYGLDLSGSVNSQIFIQVSYSAPVNVSFMANQQPTISLNAGNGAVATFNSFGNDFHTILTFIYVVGAGQSTPHLDYLSTSSLVLPMGTTITAASNPKVQASLALPAPGSATSLSGSSSIAIQTNAQATPFVANVASTAVNGTYGVGAQIPIVVSLSGAVTNAQSAQLQLKLANGQTAVAMYASGTGSNTLTFTYTVAAGQSTPPVSCLTTYAMLVLNQNTNLLPPGVWRSRVARDSIVASESIPPARRRRQSSTFAALVPDFRQYQAAATSFRLKWTSVGR